MDVKNMAKRRAQGNRRVSAAAEARSELGAARGVADFDVGSHGAAFADLDNVVSLASLDNVAIKISGACTLSHQPFPYPDIWESLNKVFDAFGFDRCLWGTDWTRAVDLLTYEQGVEAFRVTDQLSDAERSTLMGGSLAKIYKWSPN